MMSHVLVLMAPQPGALPAERIAKIMAPSSAEQFGPLRWLHHATACEFDWTPSQAKRSDTGSLKDCPPNTLLDTAHADGIDIALIPSKDRQNMLLLSDMDSTMIQQECIDELADFAGLKSQVATITQRAMNGELDFAAALTERVALLAGLPISTLQTVVDLRLQLMPGARTLVQTMKANAAHCVLVSGGFTYFTKAIAEQIGFDATFANTLEITDGHLTGRVIPPILGAQAKLETLNRCLSEKSLSSTHTIAVGDGANDLPMIEAAGLGVAFRAHPVLAGRADVVIQHCDLTALLHLQGYTRDEFVD